MVEKEMIEKDSNEKKLIEEAKEISIKEASAYSFMDGFGLRYITPYALAVGATNTQIGLLSSLPSLLGNLSQIHSLQIMKKWTRKKIVAIAVFLQAIMWLMLIAAGTFYFLFHANSNLSSYAIITIYTLLILFGAFGGPAWQSWMKDLVTENSGVYFGRRSRIATAIALVCMLIGGFLLDYFKQTHVFVGFIILFTIAFIGRAISGRLVLKQYEPDFKTDDSMYFSLKDFIKKMHQNNFGKFVIYYSLLVFSVNISSPFLGVYMLNNLKFSYSYYMAVALLAPTITTLLFVTFWGKFADKYGNLKVMKITGMLIPIMPFMWVLSIFLQGQSQIILLIFLFLTESLSGFLWAGMNLSAGNFIYDAVTRQRLAICATYFNIISSVGVLIGALLGGIISSYNFSFLGLNSLLFIFLIGGIMRVLVYIFMMPKIKEVREVEPFSVRHRMQKIKNKFVFGISTGKFFEAFGPGSRIE